MSATADLLTAALAESGIQKDTANVPEVSPNAKAENDSANQVDLFSQALFMLDEVTDEPAKDESSQPVAQSEQTLLPSNTDRAENEIVQTTTRPTLLTNNNGNNLTPIPHQLLPKVSGNKTVFIRTSDGKFVKVDHPEISHQDQANIGLMKNGSASGLVSAAQLNASSLSQKDVSRIWSNNDVVVQHANPMEDEEAEDEEELGVAETYADYMPSKLNIGCRHPDPVVETSSLSSVEPPDVWYDLSIPEPVIDEGELSALQLEAIVYACQRHETILVSGDRAGYLIGDGAGVGKGRTVAGIIYENWLIGRKRSLWFSVSTDLKLDAERDLNDIGATKIPVFPLNKFKYGKISSAENGYVKKGIIFSTYSSLIGESATRGKYKTRLKMLLNWCGADFDGVIVLDECHKAKNLCPSSSSSKPTKTGMAVLALQQRLPKARIVYASATGATEPRNMAYMSRLGLWGPGTPFQEFKDFIHAVERRGVGAMELVAMDMKLRGMYIARQLSFKGVSFKIDDIPVPKDNIKTYNAAVDLWVDAREKFHEAAALIDAERVMAKSMWGQFWSAHQRFFKYLCISSKTRHAIRIARDAVKHGKCVVIGLQSTGEARMIEQLEEQGGELTDFVSTAKGVFQSLIDKHFPAPDRKKTLDLFGLDGKGSIFDDPDLKSIFNKTRDRRRVTLALRGRSTRSGHNSVYREDKLSDDSSSESGSDFKPSGDENSDQDSEMNSEEESDDEDETQDDSEGDFNPFQGSDDDEDPWLKKTKKTKTDTNSNSKPKGSKRKAKHKDKSSKKPKPDPSSSNRKRVHDSEESVESSDLSGSEIDEIMDSVLGKQKRKQLEMKPAIESRSASNSGAGTPVPTLTPNEAREKAQQMKKSLLEGIERLGEKLPPNTLDELVDELGGTDAVAEMTGRKGRVVSDSTGAISYQLRSEQDVPLEILNLTEKQRFMDGEKYIAIISEAASSGISLQADRRVDNQRRRVHITLELPWSADRAIQQFGRTHRSNQVSAPEYMFLISELAGERRFASTVAKRLESLGALTHGDRRATESRDLSQFNIDNKYGRAALEICMKSIVGLERPLISPPSHYKGDFMADVREALVGVGLVSKVGKHKTASLEKDYNQISKFLNRILGCRVEVQNTLFQYFTDTLNAVILQAKKNGRFDQGILDLGSGAENVKVLNRQSFDSEYGGVSAKTELVTVSVERGLSWEQAMEIWGDHVGSDDGFYSSLSKTSRQVAVLAVALSGSRKKERLYQIYRPNTGLSPKMELLHDLKKRYKRVTPDEAEDTWLEQYDQSANMCSHEFWRGSCKRTITGTQCEVGLRTRTYHILTGSVLSVWNKVELAIAQSPGAQSSRMQVVRLRTNEGKRIVGTIIPANSRARLVQLLKQSNESPQNNTSVYHQTPIN